MENTAFKQAWSDNAGLVQLLGLCPLLAVTTTAVNGLVLGAATLATVTVTSTLVAAFRKRIPAEVRLPIIVIIIGSTVGLIDLALETFLYAIHEVLGLFVPLIVTNCIILARAESFAMKHAVGEAAMDGVITGTGFLLTLLTLGILREIIGRGTLFDGLGFAAGLPADALTLHLPHYAGFIPALLPVGAFFIMALMIAMHRHADGRKARRDAAGGKPSQTVR